MTAGVAAASFFLTCHLPCLLFKEGVLLFQLFLHFKQMPIRHVSSTQRRVKIMMAKCRNLLVGES